MQAVCYRESDGNEPVLDVLNSLPDRKRAVIENHYRVLYRRSGNLLVLLHMIRKTTSGVPKRDIATAKERWIDFKRRMDAAKRTPPRAAGHDAPGSL